MYFLDRLRRLIWPDPSAMDLLKRTIHGETIQPEIIARVCGVSREVFGRGREEAIIHLAQRLVTSSPENRETPLDIEIASPRKEGGDLGEKNASFKEFLRNIARIDLEEAERFEIVLAAAAKDPNSVLDCIEELGFEKEEYRYQLALKLFSRLPNRLGVNYKFKLSEPSRFKLCINLPASCQRELCDLVDRLDLNEENRAAVAQNACQLGCGTSVADNIKRFKLPPERQDEVALVLAQQEKRNAFYSLFQFELSSEIAYLRAAEAALPDEEERFQMAMSANFWADSKFVRMYALNEEHRFLFAKKCASLNPEAFAEGFRLFGIKSSERRYELIKPIASALGSKILKYLSHFEIEDPQQLREVVEMAIPEKESRIEHLKDALTRGLEVRKPIRFLGFTDEELFDILLKDPYLESKWRDYGIQDPKFLEELVVRRFRNSANISRFIESAGITDQEQCFQIALRCAEENPSRLVIRSFPILDENRRFKIAQWMATKRPELLARSFFSYRIKEGVKMRELLQSLAGGIGYTVLEMLVVSGAIDSNSSNFFYQTVRELFPDEAKRAETAHLAFEYDRDNPMDINKYQIDDEERLFELAEVAVRKNPLLLTSYLRPYKIKGEEKIYRLISKTYPFYSVRNRMELLKTLKELPFHSVEMRVQATLLFKEEFQAMLNSKPSEALDLLKEIIPVNILDPDSSFRVHLLLMLKLVGYSDANEESTLFKDLIKMKNPLARLVFLQLLIRHGKSLEHPLGLTAMDVMRKLFTLSKMPVKPFKDEMLKASFILKASALFEWADRSFDTVRPFLEVAAHFGGASSASKREFLELLSSIVLLGGGSWLLTLKNRMEDLKDKEIRLAECRERKMTKVEQDALKSLELDVKREESQLREDLEKRLADLFSSSFHVSTRDNFAAKYMKTFGSWCRPGDLLVYFAGLRTLNDLDGESVRSNFSTFVSDVLEGTFQEMRYTSYHFLTLLKGKEELQRAWRSGPSKNVTVSFTLQTVSYRDELKLKFQEKHLPDEIALQVAPFLEKGNNESPPSELTDLQMALIRLAREGASHLEEVKKELEKLSPQPQLLSDVNDWIEASKKGRVDLPEKLLLVDTDEPELLFRMGEVSGSCQRVDGDAFLNKGLMGTALSEDRMLALIDKEGVIRARALLRILDLGGGRPALFLERLYPRTLIGDAHRFIIDFAKERALSLKLPLYTLNEGEGEIVDAAVMLESHGGRGAYKYVDAVTGNTPNGKFIIRGSESLPLRKLV